MGSTLYKNSWIGSLVTYCSLHSIHVVASVSRGGTTSSLPSTFSSTSSTTESYPGLIFQQTPRRASSWRSSWTCDFWKKTLAKSSRWSPRRCKSVTSAFCHANSTRSRSMTLSWTPCNSVTKNITIKRSLSRISAPLSVTLDLRQNQSVWETMCTIGTSSQWITAKPTKKTTYKFIWKHSKEANRSCLVVCPSIAAMKWEMKIR